MKPTRSVSVIVPYFNMHDTIAETVRSCLAQPGVDVEVWLVDDGSVDLAARYARDLASTDQRIDYVRIDHSGIPGFVRNVGLERARADYIQFLDADDVIAQGKLALQCDAMAAEPGCVAYSDYLMFWSDCAERPPERLGPPHDEHWPTDLAAQFSAYAVLHRFLFPRVALEDHGGFDERLSHAEDLDLWLRLLIAGVPFRYLDQPMAFYRQHQGHSLDSPEREVAGRKQVVANCRSYLNARGLLPKYEGDMQRMEALATQPAWMVSG